MAKGKDKWPGAAMNAKQRMQQKAKKEKAKAQNTGGQPASFSSTSSVIGALTAALHEKGFMSISDAASCLMKVGLPYPKPLKTYLAMNSQIFKLCGRSCESVVLVSEAGAARAQEVEGQHLFGSNTRALVTALIEALQVQGMMAVSNVGGMVSKLGLTYSGKLKSILILNPHIFRVCGKSNSERVVLACGADTSVPWGETAHQFAGTSVPSGETAQQWAGTSVPSGETAHQWAGTAVPSRETAHQWAGTSVPPGETAHQWAGTSFPSGETAHQWGGTSVPSGETAHQWAGTSVPSGETAHQWAGTSVPSGETAQQLAGTAVPSGEAAQQWAGTSVPPGETAHQWAGTAVPSGETAHQWAGAKRAAAPMAEVLYEWADTQRTTLDAGQETGEVQAADSPDAVGTATGTVVAAHTGTELVKPKLELQEFGIPSPHHHGGLAFNSTHKRTRFGGLDDEDEVGVGPGGEHADIPGFNFGGASGFHTQLVVIQTEADMEMAVAELLRAPTIALDCEGQSLGRSGRLCLVQVATATRTFVFDVVAMSPEGVAAMEQSLGRVLESPQIQKVIHDCRQDSAALWHQHKIKLANVFDTQAAFVNMERRRQASEGIAQPAQTKLPGLNTLLDRYAPFLRNPHKDRVTGLMRSDPDLWVRRPLPGHLLEYAAGDVRGLLAVRAGILEEMQAVAMGECVAAGERYAALGRDPDVESAPPVSAEEVPMAFDQQGRLVEVVVGEGEEAAVAEAAENGCSIPRSVSGAEDIICLLPSDIARDPHLSGPGLESLLEVTLDVGRPPVAWFYPSTRVAIGAPERVVTREDVSACVKAVGRFGQDNRAGVEGTLHRISAMRNRHDEVVGLTFRVGRTVPGCSDLVTDALCREGNILLLGAPGSGKTTVIRDIAAELSMRYRTIVVDTSNEIGGDGDMPHPCLGQARRMQVRCLDEQDVVMMECVKNHSPEVIVVDEIGRLKEARAARTIAQRGVRLIASAHGSLSSAIQDELISDLLGGADHVTVGDRVARSCGGNKIRQQRKHASIFQTVIELSDHHTWTVFRDVEDKLDKILGGQPYEAQVRRRDPETGRMLVRTEIRRGAQNDKLVPPI